MRAAWLAVAMPACAGCWKDPAYIEHFPQEDGDKPEVFEFNHVQVCTLKLDEVPALFRHVDAFTRSVWLYPHTIAEPSDRIVAVYTGGLPMRIHLMVERLASDRYRVGISSHGGAGCQEVCERAARRDLYPPVAASRTAAISVASYATAR